MSDIVVADRGRRLSFTHADLLRAHQGGSPAGVAVAFKVLERALPLLERDGPCERSAVVVDTAFGGPGARDAFEAALGAVSGGRYRVDPELADPRLGSERERFVFRVGLEARGGAGEPPRTVTALLRDGLVEPEFIELARAERRSADQERRLDGLKADLAARVLSLPAAQVLDVLRPCAGDELGEVLAIVNAAAEAYRGVIPADRRFDPYMSREELEAEVAAGVALWGYEAAGELLGAMGIQRVRDVDLIRHAYVRPGAQGAGVGGALLRHLRGIGERRMLVGTWAAAEWAIRFYRRHGFELTSREEGARLLRTYWSIPERQLETSVVLAAPAI